MGAENQIGDAGATALAGALGSGKCGVTVFYLGGAWHGPPLCFGAGVASGWTSRA